MTVNRDVFDPSELVKINSDDFVILASGGPLLRVICTEGENVLCEWTEKETRRQMLFPAVALRRLQRLDPKQAIRSDQAT